MGEPLINAIDRAMLQAVVTTEARLRIEECISALKDARDHYKFALENVAALDPADSGDGENEWGEAEMFHRAQEIAEVALAEGEKKCHDVK